MTDGSCRYVGSKAVWSCCMDCGSNGCNGVCMPSPPCCGGNSDGDDDSCCCFPSSTSWPGFAITILLVFWIGIDRVLFSTDFVFDVV